jgi:hypothetical protein
MKVRTEGVRFLEVGCAICGDVIYLKKTDDYTPQLIDD